MTRSLFCMVLAAILGASAGQARLPQGRAIAVGGRPVALVGSGNQLWLLTCDRGCAGRAQRSQGRIVRIDARSGRVSRSGSIERPGALAIAPTGPIVTDFWGNAIRLFDPATLRPVTKLNLVLPFAIAPGDRAFSPTSVASVAKSVWVSTARGALARSDSRLTRVMTTVRLPLESTGDVAATARAVWVAESLAGVYRVNPASNKVAARIRIGTLQERRLSIERIFVGRGEVIAIGAETSDGALTGANGVAVIDHQSNRVRFHFGLPSGSLAASFGGGSLWVGRSGGSQLNRIDPLSGKVTERLPARVGVLLAFAHGQVWTADAKGKVRRLPIVS